MISGHGRSFGFDTADGGSLRLGIPDVDVSVDNNNIFGSPYITRHLPLVG
jgi:hypothetical protein